MFDQTSIRNIEDCKLEAITIIFELVYRFKAESWHRYQPLYLGLFRLSFNKALSELGVCDLFEHCC